MKRIQAIYDKPSQTNQADLDIPYILMYVDRIDKNVRTLEVKLVKESASRNNLEKETVQEIKRFVASFHESLVEKTKTLTGELYAKIYRD